MFLNVLGDVTCKAGSTDISIPEQLASIIALVYNLIKIGVPIILIINGMLDLGKAVIAQKDEEITKGKKTFMSRLIAAAIVFLVFVIVQLVVSLVNTPDKDGNIWTCVKALLGA